jgi:hypothetical protein
MRRLIITAVTAAAALSAAALPVTAASAAAGPQMARPARAASPAADGIDDSFLGESCAGRAFCMAVGYYILNGSFAGLSETLSGSRWVVKPVARPPRRQRILANGVSCASPAACLLVGYHTGGLTSTESGLAESWNGSSWRVVGLGGPAGSAFSILNAAACPAVSFCLAVGMAGIDGGYEEIAYTWIKGRWRPSSLPAPAGPDISKLSGLACSSTRNCMAVGDYVNPAGTTLPYAVRWHDGRRTVMALPSVPNEQSTSLAAVSCPTATMCVAVGSYSSTNGYHAIAERWNNGRWHISLTFPVPSGFAGITCPAPDRCFAVGGVQEGPLIETWNGRKWTAQQPGTTTSYPYTGSYLTQVSCLTESRCEAVGGRLDPYDSTSLTLAESWNGRRWTTQATANP